jgi:hypothetical protein
MRRIRCHRSTSGHSTRRGCRSVLVPSAAARIESRLRVDSGGMIPLTGTAGIGAVPPPDASANDRTPLIDQPLGAAETAAVRKDVMLD